LCKTPPPPPPNFFLRRPCRGLSSPLGFFFFFFFFAPPLKFPPSSQPASLVSPPGCLLVEPNVVQLVRVVKEAGSKSAVLHIYMRRKKKKNIVVYEDRQYIGMLYIYIYIYIERELHTYVLSVFIYHDIYIFTPYNKKNHIYIYICLNVVVSPPSLSALSAPPLPLSLSLLTFFQLIQW
jgi:hypothetical protein